MPSDHLILLHPTISSSRQAPLAMGFSRQEYWSGLPYTSPGDLPDPGTEPVSLASPALVGRFASSALAGPALARERERVAQSCPTLCNPMNCTRQAPLSMELSRQEYWSGLPFPSPGDLPDPEMEPRSPAVQADSLPSELPGKSW